MIMKDPHEMIMKMTVSELKMMLKGVKRISCLNKLELVEVVLRRYDYSSIIVMCLSPEKRDQYQLNDIPSTPKEFIQIDRQLEKCILSS